VPQLHQLLPSLLSVLLSSTLPASPLLRTHAAALLRHIVVQHSSSYPSLRPRLLRTLRAALQARSTPAGQSAATKTGAVLGVRGLGKEAIKKVLVQQDTMEALGQWCSEKEEEAGEVQRVVLVSLQCLSGAVLRPLQATLRCQRPGQSVSPQSAALATPQSRKAQRSKVAFLTLPLLHRKRSPTLHPATPLAADPPTAPHPLRYRRVWATFGRSS
jgi:hypothetical protein